MSNRESDYSEIQLRGIPTSPKEDNLVLPLIARWTPTMGLKVFIQRVMPQTIILNSGFVRNVITEKPVWLFIGGEWDCTGHCNTKDKDKVEAVLLASLIDKLKQQTMTLTNEYVKLVGDNSLIETINNEEGD